MANQLNSIIQNGNVATHLTNAKLGYNRAFRAEGNVIPVHLNQHYESNFYNLDATHTHSGFINFNANIRIYTLGHFSIYDQEVNVLSERNASEKPIELLKALIAQGGRNVGVIRLCEALWPDVDGDVAHSSFSVTLHRLRKILGRNTLLLEGNRLSLNPDECWVDAWCCEYFMKELDYQFTWNRLDEDYAVLLVNNLVALYNGAFLGNEDEHSWDIMYRETLHNKFLRILMSVCGYFEKKGECQKALQLYHKAIEMDPSSEDVYYRLIKCYIAGGRKSEAITAYNRCKTIIRTSLDIGLSDRMESLYQTISQ